MSSRRQQADPIPVNEETALYTARAGPRAAQLCNPKRQIATGSGPHLTTETQNLLRVRLPAAALILLIGFSAFLVRHVVGVLTGEPLYPVLLGAHIATVLVLGFSALPLC